MRKLALTTLAVSLAIGAVADGAMAARTTRTEQAPVTTAQADQKVAFGFGFYTCVDTMYRYGRGRYGGGVSDNVLLQAAVDVCGPYYR